MSPKILVSSLKCLCAEFVSNRLIQVLSEEEGLYDEAARNYLSDVPSAVLQDILRTILSSWNLDAATRFSSLEILLRNDVRKLDVGVFPHSYYEKILQVIISRGRGLHQLNLKGVWAREHPLLLSQLIGSLDNLRVLIIPHMADDAVLESIARCRNLYVLDISGEAYFTSGGLKCLRNENLQILDIGNYGKREVCESSSDDAILISGLIGSLPNLKSIRTYGFTGKSLLFAHRLKICSNTKLTYLHDIKTTNEIFDAILDLCPNLESIHIESPDEGVISRLKNLKKLICLKLTKPSVREVIQFFKDSGSELETIKLNHNKNESLDLSLIAARSMRVHTMEFYNMRLNVSDSDTFFMNLCSIEICYCDITDNCMKQILMNSPFLKTVRIGCVLNLSDGDIFRVCAVSDFVFLEELWFSSARRLTVMSIELLMGHCSKLKKLGQMNGWDVTSEEIDILRDFIEISNIDLILEPLVI